MPPEETIITLGFGDLAINGSKVLVRM